MYWWILCSFLRSFEENRVFSQSSDKNPMYFFFQSSYQNSCFSRDSLTNIAFFSYSLAKVAFIQRFFDESHLYYLFFYYLLAKFALFSFFRIVSYLLLKNKPWRRLEFLGLGITVSLKVLGICTYTSLPINSN